VTLSYQPFASADTREVGAKYELRSAAALDGRAAKNKQSGCSLPRVSLGSKEAQASVAANVQYRALGLLTGSWFLARTRQSANSVQTKTPRKQKQRNADVLKQIENPISRLVQANGEGALSRWGTTENFEIQRTGKTPHLIRRL